MGNRARNTKRRSPSTPKIMVVDAAEAGAVNGTVTLRCGPALRHIAPALISLPYESVPDLPQQLASLAREAEKDYWALLPHILRSAPSEDPLAVAQAAERVIRAQDWAGAVAAAPRGNPVLFHFAGRVALAADAPFSRTPALLAFDPLQLKRLAPSLEASHARARAQLTAGPPAPAGERAAAAVKQLAAAPWPPGPTNGPSPEEARKVVDGQRREFLQRVPYQYTPDTGSIHDAPAGMRWTPLLHPCGCTIAWGWDTSEMDPRMFVDFCRERFTLPCPWHAESGPTPPQPAADQPLRVRCPTLARHTWARPATGDQIQLGVELSRQLSEFTDTLTHSDPEILTAGLPPRWLTIVREMGQDPIQAWSDQRLLDIVLNHGRDTLASLAALETRRPRNSDGPA